MSMMRDDVRGIFEPMREDFFVVTHRCFFYYYFFFIIIFFFKRPSCCPSIVAASLSLWEIRGEEEVGNVVVDEMGGDGGIRWWVQ